MPGIRSSRRRLLPVTASARSATVRPDRTESAVRGPTPGMADQLAERAPLGCGEEAEEEVRILADHEVGEEGDGSAAAGRR